MMKTRRSALRAGLVSLSGLACVGRPPGARASPTLESRALDDDRKGIDDVLLAARRAACGVPALLQRDDLCGAFVLGVI